MHFVDLVRIHVHAGDGGRGCISFRREKYVPKGGPDGGDGGNGGSVIAVGDRHLLTLYDLKVAPSVVADSGDHGQGNNCTGRSGGDKIIPLPLGTIIIDEETGEEIGDITDDGQRLVLAKGGDGGRGNQHFATPTNRAPREADGGWPGEERRLILELKLIADVGLVGLPNAGKSTLLAALTRATPKIASYPFTTIHPNLGVMALPHIDTCTIADLPGLIEGASRGAGLGDRFLRHIERTRLLVHLVPLDAAEDRDPETLWYQFELVNKELTAYSDTLAQRPQIVALTKADLAEGEEEIELLKQHFRDRGIAPLVLCAPLDTGLSDLIQAMDARLVEMNRREQESIT